MTQARSSVPTGGEHMVIRPAVQDDAGAIRALIEPYVEAKIILARTLDEITELLADFLVAEADGVVVGCAVLEIYSPKMAELRSLAVHADWQKKGIGRQLVQACLDRARERNIREVLAITSTEAVFRSCGFDFTLPGERKAG